MPLDGDNPTYQEIEGVVKIGAALGNGLGKGRSEKDVVAYLHGE